MHSRLHRLIILCCCLLAAAVSRAQDTVDTDAITYDLYVHQEWDRLLQIGHEALDRGEDFYFLRYRMGIALYEQKKYRLALHHFQRAFAMNDQDETLKEYIYYCYTFTGQYAHALRMTSKFAPPTLDRTKTASRPLIHFGNVAYGYKWASDDSLYQPMHYVEAGIGFRLGRHATAYTSFTNISQQTYYGTLSQQQGYLGLDIPLARSWSLSPAVNYIGYSFGQVPGHTVTVPVQQPPPPGGGPPPPPVYVATTVTPEYKGNILVAALSATKMIRAWTFSGTFTWADMNGVKQHQEHLSATYTTPSEKLSIRTAITLLSNDTGARFKPMPSLGASFRLARKLSVGGSFALFNASGFTEQNGSVVSNSWDATHSRLQAGADWNCFRNISVYGVFQHEQKTEWYTRKNYQFNMIIAGIKVIF